MIELVTSLLGGGNGLLVGLAAILAFVVGAFFKGRSSGKKTEQAKQSRIRVETMKKSDRIEQEVAGNAPDDNRAKLKKWSKS